MNRRCSAPIWFLSFVSDFVAPISVLEGKRRQVMIETACLLAQRGRRLRFGRGDVEDVEADGGKDFRLQTAILPLFQQHLGFFCQCGPEIVRPCERRKSCRA